MSKYPENPNLADDAWELAGNHLPDIEAIRRQARIDFADELTRKGIYSFNIHDIRKYASE